MATPFPRLQAVPHHEPAAARAHRWEARLFGDFRLRAPDGSNATPVGRKARALLAYLLATPDAALRDRLSGLLWSERGEDQARASLRQTLYQIRALKSGDTPLIAIDRTRAWVVARYITTDVGRIDAPASDDRAVALAALVGERLPEFLADLDGIDPAFDDWLALERTRRHDQRRRALLALAERNLATGDADSAQRLADRLLSCDATDEAAARLAMRAGHCRDDRDGVRRIFMRLQEALALQIGVPVSEETVETHRRALDAPVSRPSIRLVPPTPDRDVRSTAMHDRNAESPTDEAVAARTPDFDVPMRRRSSRSGPRAWLVAAIGCATMLLALAVVALRATAPAQTCSLSAEPLPSPATGFAALASTVGSSD